MTPLQKTACAFMSAAFVVLVIMIGIVIVVDRQTNYAQAQLLPYTERMITYTIKPAPAGFDDTVVDSFKFSSVTFSPGIVIHDDGNVDIPPNMNLTEASKRFWNAVSLIRGRPPVFSDVTR